MDDKDDKNNKDDKTTRRQDDKTTRRQDDKMTRRQTRQGRQVKSQTRASIEKKRKTGRNVCNYNNKNK